MMRGLNIYKRKDGRYEGRITREKATDGKRSYQYFFGETSSTSKNEVGTTIICTGCRA